VEVGAGAENDLYENQKAEPRHGKKQRIPFDGQLTVEELPAQPQTGKQQGAGFEDES